MSTVYLVLNEYLDEEEHFTEVEGVFSDEGKARTYRAKLEITMGSDNRTFEIKALQIDAGVTEEIYYAAYYTGLEDVSETGEFEIDASRIAIGAEGLGVALPEGRIRREVITNSARLEVARRIFATAYGWSETDARLRLVDLVRAFLANEVS